MVELKSTESQLALNLETKIEEFPRCLEGLLKVDTMELIKCLGKHYGWQQPRKQEEAWKNWKQYDRIFQYYFMGYIIMALDNMGLTAQLYYFSLNERKELREFIAGCLSYDASPEELAAFRRGRKDTRKRR